MPTSRPAPAISAQPIAEGQALMKALRGRLSGLAQPTYVLDIPGGHGKVPVGPNYLARRERRVLRGGHLGRNAPLP